MMLFKRNEKCSAGYLARQRVKVIEQTIVYFAIPLALYIIGYVTTGSNRNILTLFAVLGFLPASKCAVNMIMLLRNKGCSENLRKEIEKRASNVPQLFDSVLTTYDVTYTISHFAYLQNTLIGITENPKCIPTDKKNNPAGCEKHLKDMLAKDGVKDVQIKIFTDTNKYLTRLEQLEQLSGEADAKQGSAKVFKLVKDISL